MGFRARIAWVPAWAAWAAFLGFCAALFVNTLLFGRLPLVAVILGWPRSATLTILLLLVAGWWLGYGILMHRQGNYRRFRTAIIPAVPLLLGTALPLLLIYSSDLLNHHFYYSMVHKNEPKTFALLLLLLVATLLLQAVHVELAAGKPTTSAWQTTCLRLREPLVIVLLAVLGYLQVSAYLDRLYADFVVRYWPVADAMIKGGPYPVTMVVGAWPSYFIEGGLSEYLVDLPIYPVSVAISFLVFGHNVVAAYLPTVIPNVLLPIAYYLLSREVLRNRCVALLMVGAVMLFPPLRLYALNWTGPDPVYYLFYITSCWLYVRVARGDRSTSVWMLLGLMTSAMALTRPEGIAYAVIYVCAVWTVRANHMHKLVTSILFVIPVGAFSLFLMATFQMPWPRNWLGSLSIGNVAGNWVYLSRAPLDLAAQAIRLSPEDVVGFTALLLSGALAGTLYMFRREWRIGILLIPAWANFVMVLVVDPRVSGAYLWYDFFRHISYPLPLFALSFGVVVKALVQAVQGRYLRIIAVTVTAILLFWIVTWNLHLMSKPAFGYGDDASNILGTATRLNFIELVTHRPFELPVLEFGLIHGYWTTTSWGDGFWVYPAFLDEFFEEFDAVGRATGVAYETASLFLFLGLLLLRLVPEAITAEQAARIRSLACLRPRFGRRYHNRLEGQGSPAVTR